ncbi:unnamed protein product [Mytilus coruscus]|uniref:SWIM-type domain-containing protein n=1 Tax=Mytilus coruscus TaxID=42192 RepID=A0A6J8BAC7_MYTCO|nr:unnamed protein product [Mytilus coruscus]
MAASYGSSAVWTLSLRHVPPFTQAEVDKWANDSAKVPRAKMQKAYSNFIEGYVHDIEVQASESAVFVRAYAYPSMRKNNPPYRLTVKLSKSSPVEFKSTQCECKARNGNCSHCIGLLYILSHFQKLGLKAVPPFQSKTLKTSMPQAWHLPSRTEGLTPKTVDSLEISKVKAEAQKPKKRKRVVEGILPNVYCPVKQPIPSVEFTSTLVQHLVSFQSDAQILKSVRNPTDITMIDSSFGPVPFGSVLSYQQRPSTIETNIINHQNMPSFPEIILPNHDNDFTTVLNQSENEVYLGLQFNHASALEPERETIHQGQTELWHKVRQHRLTSSIFKDVCGRKADFEKLAERLLNKKNIQTAAMKFGIEHESAAAKLYSDITGNNVYLCGEDYHKERIYMDEDKWLDIKSSLNKFYFEILLPQIVKQSSK